MGAERDSASAFRPAILRDPPQDMPPLPLTRASPTNEVVGSQRGGREPLQPLVLGKGGWEGSPPHPHCPLRLLSPPPAGETSQTSQPPQSDASPLLQPGLIGGPGAEPRARVGACTQTQTYIRIPPPPRRAAGLTLGEDSVAFQQPQRQDPRGPRSGVTSGWLCVGLHLPQM